MHNHYAANCGTQNYVAGAFENSAVVKSSKLTPNQIQQMIVHLSNQLQLQQSYTGDAVETSGTIEPVTSSLSGNISSIFVFAASQPLITN